MYVSGSPLGTNLTSQVEAAALQGDRVSIWYSDGNLGFFGRFQLALGASTDVVCVADDDVVMGKDWLGAAVDALHSNEWGSGVVGTRGARYVCQEQGGVCGQTGEFHRFATEMDAGWSLWCARKRIWRTVWRERPWTFKTGEDMTLSYASRKFAGGPTVRISSRHENLNGANDLALMGSQTSWLSDISPDGGDELVDPDGRIEERVEQRVHNPLRNSLLLELHTRGNVLSMSKYRPARPGVLVLIDDSESLVALAQSSRRLCSSLEGQVWGGLKRKCFVGMLHYREEAIDVDEALLVLREKGHYDRTSPGWKVRRDSGVYRLLPDHGPLFAMASTMVDCAAILESFRPVAVVVPDDGSVVTAAVALISAVYGVHTVSPSSAHANFGGVALQALRHVVQSRGFGGHGWARMNNRELSGVSNATLIAFCGSRQRRSWWSDSVRLLESEVTSASEMWTLAPPSTHRASSFSEAAAAARLSSQAVLDKRTWSVVASTEWQDDWYMNGGPLLRAFHLALQSFTTDVVVVDACSHDPSETVDMVRRALKSVGSQEKPQLVVGRGVGVSCDPGGANCVVDTSGTTVSFGLGVWALRSQFVRHVVREAVPPRVSVDESNWLEVVSSFLSGMLLKYGGIETVSLRSPGSIRRGFTSSFFSSLCASLVCGRYSVKVVGDVELVYADSCRQCVATVGSGHLLMLRDATSMSFCCDAAIQRSLVVYDAHVSMDARVQDVLSDIILAIGYVIETVHLTSVKIVPDGASGSFAVAFAASTAGVPVVTVSPQGVWHSMFASFTEELIQISNNQTHDRHMKDNEIREEL